MQPDFEEILRSEIKNHLDAWFDEEIADAMLAMGAAEDQVDFLAARAVYAKLVEMKGRPEQEHRLREEAETHNVKETQDAGKRRGAGGWLRRRIQPAG